MPASGGDLVETALRTALASGSSSTSTGDKSSLDSHLAGANLAKKVLYGSIDFESTGSYQSTVLNTLKSKYIILQSPKKSEPSKADSTRNEETLELPQHTLFPLEAVQLGWNGLDWGVGAGMMNMGNTCYMNSTLQALFHVPALVNWLISDKQHMVQCENNATTQGGCIICAVHKTLQASQQRNTNVIRPWLLFSKLRLVCRHLVPGRQEDAHEFLRYLVEAMEKAYLQRFRNTANLDPRSKETTPLNQILGGYLRSTVRCLECGHVSTTFQHFQDLLLDIRKATTVEDALDLYFSREKLDDMAYHCEACQRKVQATKQFSLERAPMVLCIQLKRFSITNNKISKHVPFKTRLELTRFARKRPAVPLVYRLVAVVTHMGPTVGCGHYTAVAQVPSGNFYTFDDSSVKPITLQNMLTTNAYIMLYELESTQSASHSPSVSSKAYKSVPSSSTAVSNSPAEAVLPMPKPSVNGVLQTTSDSESTSSSSHLIINGHSSVEQKTDSSSESELGDPPSGEPAKPNKSPPNAFIANSAQSFRGEHLSVTPITQSAILSDSDQGLKEMPASLTNGPQSSPTKLVPYEVDDSNSSTEEPETLVTSKSGVWQVTPANTLTNGNSIRQEQYNGYNKKCTALSELVRMSHNGYAAPVNSWNGSRAQLDREVSNDRREERKRSLSNDENQCKIKYPRTNQPQTNGNKTGYNSFQEFQNSKRWKTEHYHRSYYGNARHRNHRRNYNHHHNNHYRRFNNRH